MKKVVIASLMMVFGIAAQAQTGKSDNVTLNVKLNPIQTLIVKTDQKTVDLNYVDRANYLNGVSSTQDNHLNVFSTGGFEVKVKSSSSELVNQAAAGPNGNIDAGSVKITAMAGTQDALTVAQYNPAVALSATEGTIVSSTKGAVDRNIGVKYEAAGANAYIDKYVANQTPTVFTTTVTYTIYAK